MRTGCVKCPGFAPIKTALDDLGLACHGIMLLRKGRTSEDPPFFFAVLLKTKSSAGGL